MWQYLRNLYKRYQRLELDFSFFSRNRRYRDCIGEVKSSKTVSTNPHRLTRTSTPGARLFDTIFHQAFGRTTPDDIANERHNWSCAALTFPADPKVDRIVANFLSNSLCALFLDLQIMDFSEMTSKTMTLKLRIRKLKKCLIYKMP